MRGRDCTRIQCVRDDDDKQRTSSRRPGARFSRHDTAVEDLGPSLPDSNGSSHAAESLDRKSFVMEKQRPAIPGIGPNNSPARGSDTAVTVPMVIRG